MRGFARVLRGLRSAVPIAIAIGASQAHAADLAEAEKDVAAEPHRDHFVLGTKGVNTLERAVSHGEEVIISGYGFAGVAEATLLHGRLAVELDVVITSPGGERSLAGEPLVKLPWHLSPWLEPYIGAGPVLLHVRDGRSERFWMGGGQLVLGAFVWFADIAGIDLDVALGAAHGPQMSITELTLAIGPVLRD